jgi:hypothetical protein
MTKQLLTVLGTLSLVGCGGSGVPYDGGAPQVDDWGSHTGIAGSGATGGSDQGQGGVGEETAGAGGTYVGGGGYGVAGTDSSGYAGGGGYGVAGTDSSGYAGGGGYGVAGTGSGGTDAGGGYANGGTGVGGGNGSLCLQNVAQCFDAAANCYQYSPWSDCDQIVDVCAAMQAECGE